MLIHVDLARLEIHLSTLEQQVIQIQRNSKMLEQWRESALMIPGSNLALIDRQICFMEQQSHNTRKKIDFLLEMQELLVRSSNRLECDIISAENALKRLE